MVKRKSGSIKLYTKILIFLEKTKSEIKKRFPENLLLEFEANQHPERPVTTVAVESGFSKVKYGIGKYRRSLKIFEHELRLRETEFEPDFIEIVNQNVQNHPARKTKKRLADNSLIEEPAAKKNCS